MTNLAKYIKAKRKEFGLTQIDLSQKSGVGLRFVREMEQGKKSIANLFKNFERAYPKIPLLTRYTRILGICI